MLKRFLEIEVDEEGNQLQLEQRVNHKLFLGGELDLGLASGKKKILNQLKIASYKDLIEDRLGQFPVISISFKEVKGNSYEEIEAKVKLNVKNLYKNHNYLLYSDKISLEEKRDFQDYLEAKINLVQLQDSLLFLSSLLFKYFGQKAYILIDEYDAPINNSYLKFGQESKEFELVLDIFRGMLSSSLKGNPYLERGLITGILRIAKANLFSGLNNLTENTLLDEDFSRFYGFTREEVDELLTKIPTETKAEQIKDWYNGYTFGGEIIYNPWSIMQCLAHKGKLESYWIDSGSTGLIDKALLSDEMQEDLQKLIDGTNIISPITKYINFDDINNRLGLFSLLLFSGYLNPTPVEPEENIYKLSIPNNEVKRIYQTRVLQWVSKQLKIDRSEYYSFVTLLPEGKIEEFKDRLQELLLDSTSFHQTGKRGAEIFYNGFMLGLINTLAPSYVIESERESGVGRPDIVLIPKSGRGDKAIIIEYKISKTLGNIESEAINALEQIQDKKYDTKLKQLAHIKQILKIGMAFCGKEVAMQYQIDMI
jgi:hypothetical protein